MPNGGAGIPEIKAAPTISNYRAEQ